MKQCHATAPNFNPPTKEAWTTCRIEPVGRRDCRVGDYSVRHHSRNQRDHSFRHVVPMTAPYTRESLVVAQPKLVGGSTTRVSMAE